MTLITFTHRGENTTLFSEITMTANKLVVIFLAVWLCHDTGITLVSAVSAATRTFAQQRDATTTSVSVNPTRTTTSFSGGDVRVECNFLSSEEIELFLGHRVSETRPGQPAKSHVYLDQDVIRRLYYSLCGNGKTRIFCPGELELETEAAASAPGTPLWSQPVAATTSRIHKTTHRHVDSLAVNVVVPGTVGFVFLNSNPDAHFQYDDDKETGQEGMCIPVVAGNLVAFPGRIPHNTVIESGEVRLLGTFEMERLGLVGQATLVPTPAPINSPPSDDDDTDDPKHNHPWCFSGMNAVEVYGKGFISMDSLQIGDYARAANGKFSLVFSFAHLDKNLETDFIQISVEGLEAPLEITGRHFVFVSDKAIRADTLKVGDLLGDRLVSDIQTIKRTGVYAPITESGDIIVSSVLASSYVSFLDKIYLDENMMTHMFFALHRVTCRINFSWCENETYSKDGYSNWSNWAIQTMEASYFFPIIIQNILSIVGLFTVSCWAIAEQFYLAPLASMAMAGCSVYWATSKRSV